MKRKFSIIKNHIGNDLYALVMKSWLLDEEGAETDVHSIVKSGLTLEECNSEELKFIE
jgi:hypothetical protein